jgi:ketosteroid isomerase-like protein
MLSLLDASTTQETNRIGRQAMELMMTRKEMRRLVERRFAMEARSDIDGILATCTDDIEHDAVGVPGGPVRGKVAVRARFEALTQDLQSTDLIPLHRYYGENVVVDEVLWEARAVGRPFGIDGQGRLFRVRLARVFAFRDHLIARENVWLDWVAFAAQLGALPVETPA